LRQKERTSVSEDPLLLVRTWKNPPDYGRLLWTAPFYHQELHESKEIQSLIQTLKCTKIF